MTAFYYKLNGGTFVNQSIPEKLQGKTYINPRTDTGSKRFLNIEMQKADHGFFIDRTVLYKAFLIIKGKQEMENTEEFKALAKEEKEGKPLPDFGNDIVNEALSRIKIENLDKTTLTEAEREMTTKEELACCFAYVRIKGREETRKDTKLEMVDAMLANPKLTDEDIAVISGIPLDEIQKHRAQR